VELIVLIEVVDTTPSGTRQDSGGFAYFTSSWTWLQSTPSFCTNCFILKILMTLLMFALLFSDAWFVDNRFGATDPHWRARHLWSIEFVAKKNEDDGCAEKWHSPLRQYREVKDRLQCRGSGGMMKVRFEHYQTIDEILRDKPSSACRHVVSTAGQLQVLTTACTWCMDGIFKVNRM